MPDVAATPRPKELNGSRMDQHRLMCRPSQHHLDDGLGELLGRGGLPRPSLEPGSEERKPLSGQEGDSNVTLFGAGELHVMGELVDQRGTQARSLTGDTDRDQPPDWVVRS